jgi:multiple antibiotic resistance protein
MPDGFESLPYPWILSKFGLTCIALFMLANPIEALPLFLDLTAKHSAAHRARQALKASLYAGLFMASSLLLGRVLLRVFGVSSDAVMVAGGLVVLALGFPMLMTGKVKFHDGHVKNPRKDHSLIPLAFPGICGPAAMAALISGTSYIQALDTPAKQFAGYVFVLGAIVVVCTAAWVILRFSGTIASRLGPEGLEGLCRFMGLLLIVIGVQLLADGVRGFSLARDSAPGLSLPDPRKPPLEPPTSAPED